MAERAITDPGNQIVESYYYVDDVHLFGGAVRNGDFESFGEGWTYHQQPQGPQGFEIYVDHFWTGEVRSDKYGCVIGARYNRHLAAGAICEIKQKVAIGNRPRSGLR